MEQIRTTKTTLLSLIAKGAIALGALLGGYAQGQTQKIIDYKDYLLKKEAHLSDSKVVVPKISNNTYIKDVSGVLSALEGLWVGEFKNYRYLFAIKKVTLQNEQKQIKADNLSVEYRVYDISNDGLPRISQRTHQIKDFCFIQGHRYYKSNTYSLYYNGINNDQIGFLVVSGDEFNRKTLRLIDYSEIVPFLEGPQVFPVWDKRLNLKEKCDIVRISRDTVMPQSQLDKDIPFLKNTLVLPTMEKLLIYGRMATEKNLYINCFEPQFTNRLMYGEFVPRTNIYSNNSSGTNEPTPKDELDPAGDERDFKELPYVSPYGTRFLMRYPKNAITTEATNQTYLTALNYKLLLEAYMINEIENKMPNFSPSDLKDLEGRQDRILNYYAKIRKISTSELIDKLSKDASVLFDKKNFDHPQKIVNTFRGILLTR